MKKLVYKEIFIFIILTVLTLSNLTFNTAPVKALEFNADLGDLNIEIDPTTRDPYIKEFQITDAAGAQKSAWNKVYTEYQELLVGVSGVLTLTFVVLFMKNIWAFTASAENPQERSRTLKGILWTGIGSAGFATISIIMAMAFKFFQ